MKLERFLEANAYQFEKVSESFPEIAALKTVNQHRLWHGEGNVYTHTRMVCEQLVQLEEWHHLESDQKSSLFMAALFHDLGKKNCTRFEDGRWISPNHAVKGAKQFRLLWYCKYQEKFPLSFAAREEIVGLIRYHGLPLLFLEKKTIDGTLIKAREMVSFELLHLLAKADLLGRLCQDQQEKLQLVDYFKEYAAELGCFRRPIRFYNEYTRQQFFQKQSIWHGEYLFDQTQFPVYVMSGLPLSGKDHYIKKHFSHLPVISLDQLREELGILPTEGSGAVVHAAKEQAKILLRQKRPFVWNATNVIAETRAKVIRMCERYGAGVVLVYVEVPYPELFKRNQIRERKIPVGVLNHLVQKLEVPANTEAIEVKYETEDGI